MKQQGSTSAVLFCFLPSKHGYVAATSITERDGVFGLFLWGRQEERREAGASALYKQAWSEFPNLRHSLCELKAGSPAKRCRAVKQGEKP